MKVTPAPLASRGTVWDGSGTTIFVPSRSAEAVEICVFDDAGRESSLDLPEVAEGVFAGRVEGMGPGTRYGLRVHGAWAPHEGLRHNPNKLLLDPYARRIDGAAEPADVHFGHDLEDESLPSEVDSAASELRSVVVDGAFDWQHVPRPHTPPSDSIIYETHVRGMTMRHPAVPEDLRGTYAGLASEPVIEHLTSLGVTAVELLPVQRFIHDFHLREAGLRNYWGYNSIGFFAPQPEYAAGDDPVGEFKTMVRELHRAGIEVILDVVYNHTAEGSAEGPTFCFRGLDNRSWYRLDPDDLSNYLNWTGTGNTVDASHPDVLALVMDSLRYWADDMGVDGFRFDLATVVGRTHADFDPLGGLLGAMGQDPVLSRTKLIAEPWDVGPEGYRLGGFPPRWSEWNDRYRDIVRDFWRAADGTLADYATRITGSSDIFEHGGRTPAATVNFITSHDGFTMADLVSYDEKHNEANGEDNNDGHDDNRSWNSGAEGPTDDREILELRARRVRSLMTTLLLSQGIPMILGGDEIGRSQGGNNNAYNQDGEITWFDWESADAELMAFVARLVDLRKQHPTFRRTAWLHEHARRVSDHVGWFTPRGRTMTPTSWTSPETTAVALFLGGDVIHSSAGTTTDDDFLMLFNGADHSVRFQLPPDVGPFRWTIVVDTSDVEVSDVRARANIEVEAFGAVVLQRPTT